jgi:hypothetical protein
LKEEKFGAKRLQALLNMMWWTTHAILVYVKDNNIARCRLMTSRSAKMRMAFNSYSSLKGQLKPGRENLQRK